MFDEVRLKQHSLPLLLGLLSALLYGTVVLMPLFLVPVQYTGARKGYKAMLIAAATSTIVVVVWQAVTLLRLGLLTSSTLVLGASAPAAMLLGLLLMAHPRLSVWPFVLRALLGGALAAALSLTSIFSALKDPNVKAMFIEAFEKAGAAIGSSPIDPEILWTALRAGVASSFGAVLFVVLFFSSWFGARLGLRSRSLVPVPSVDALEPQLAPKDEYPEDKASLPPVLSAYHVPSYLVWALLSAWLGLLVNRFYPSLVLSAVALNAALTLSICYGLQGLAVARALAERVGMAPALRFILPLALLLLLLSGLAGLIALGILALLGTLETWIPFRAATKGDTP